MTFERDTCSAYFRKESEDNHDRSIEEREREQGYSLEKDSNRHTDVVSLARDTLCWPNNSPSALFFCTRLV